MVLKLKKMIYNIKNYIQTHINIMSNIHKGLHVWYHKKNCIVKVLEYDIQNDSYTIECKGRVIDTTNEFIDKNIDSKCIKLHMDIMNLEDRLADLKFYSSTLKDRIKDNEDKFFQEKKLIEEDKYKLEIEIQNLLKYKELYDKSVNPNLEKGDTIIETIVLSNFTIDKTSKFLWKDLNNYSITPMIDLYTQFKDLKMWLKLHYFSYGDNIQSYKEIEKWYLEKDEYIVGVYYISDTPNNILFGSGFYPTLSCGFLSNIIFYTNYGNITDVVYYNNNMFFEAKEVVSFRVNKFLNTKMINIINKSISSGSRIVENVSKKTSKELYQFIKEVTEF